MNFDQITFKDHNIPGAIHGKVMFKNGWEISVVSGPKGSGLYGNVDDETYEVAILKNSEIVGEVSGWNTKQEVSAMMFVLSKIS